MHELHRFALQHSPPIEGMHQSITVSPTQLHLTIAMLKLFSRVRSAIIDATSTHRSPFRCLDLRDRTTVLTMV